MAIRTWKLVKLDPETHTALLLLAERLSEQSRVQVDKERSWIFARKISLDRAVHHAVHVALRVLKENGTT